MSEVPLAQGGLSGQSAFAAAALAAAAAKQIKIAPLGKDVAQAHAELEAELAVLQELMVSHQLSPSVKPCAVFTKPLVLDSKQVVHYTRLGIGFNKTLVCRFQSPSCPSRAIHPSQALPHPLSVDAG